MTSCSRRALAPLSLTWISVSEPAAVVAEDLCTAGHHLCIGMSDERAADRGEGTWREHVVGVEEPHDVSRRQRDAAVDRVVETTIRATLDPQVGLATEELQRVVRGPAVHHDVLEVRPPCERTLANASDR